MQIDKAYADCCAKHRVINLPVFANISEHRLVLANYRLNSGLCESLGLYLQSSVCRLNQDFML